MKGGKRETLFDEEHEGRKKKFERGEREQGPFVERRLKERCDD
jgi:hypothetical protein